MSQFTHDWKNLSTQQLGRYGEYLFKMKLTLHGLDIYSPEIDDRGIDFVVRTKAGDFFEIQVKSIRTFQYLFIQKSKMMPSPKRFVAFGHFRDADPVLYLIPSEAWLAPNKLFKDRDYEGKKSAPEWGIDFRESTLSLLEQYRFDDVAAMLSMSSMTVVQQDDELVAYDSKVDFA